MMKEKDMPKADFITSIILIAFSIGVIDYVDPDAPL